MENDFDEISLQEIGATLWKRRRLIFLTTFVSTALAVATALLLPVKYEASILLSPVTDTSGGKLGGAGGLLAKFGDLASLGGLSVGGSGEKDESIATLKSSALNQAFIEDNKLLSVLFPDDWDAEQHKWKLSDPDKVPTLWKAEKMFRKKIVSVEEDKKTGLVTLTIEWTDPKQAANWANDLVDRANRTLRDRAIAISKRNLDYLNAQLSKTSVVELQQALYALIESEIKKVMVAQGSEEYAFRVIDPAQVPEEKSSPMRALITVIGFLAGALLGTVLAFVLPGNQRA